MFLLKNCSTARNSWHCFIDQRVLFRNKNRLLSTANTNILPTTRKNNYLSNVSFCHRYWWGTSTNTKGKSSANTHRATKVTWNIFISYLQAKQLYDDFDAATISKLELDDILKRFYVEVRKQDGTFYHKNTFTSIPFGLQRRFKELRANFDIIEDSSFKISPFWK